MNARHARQSFLGSDIEQRTRGARAAVIGLCGGGSHVAQQLAHIGVGNFDLVDFDRADGTNINRMVGLSFSQAASGVNKVDVVAANIRAVNPQAEVRIHPRRWSEVQGEPECVNAMRQPSMGIY